MSPNFAARRFELDRLPAIVLLDKLGIIRIATPQGMRIRAVQSPSPTSTRRRRASERRGTSYLGPALALELAQPPLEIFPPPSFALGFGRSALPSA